MTLEINEEYFMQLDEKLTLVPLTYDKAFKRIFRTNLDILKEFLKDVIPLDIDKDCNIRLMDGELPKENMKEKGKIIDIYVVLDGKIYVDIEMNKSKFETVLQRNIKYKDKLSSMLPENDKDFKSITSTKLYQLNLNAYPFEKILDDIIVLYGLKTHKIYSSDECMIVKSLERYRDLYYNENNREKEVIWLTALTARTFTELYELVSLVLEEDEVRRLMEAMVNMSMDEFTIHSWQKDKMDALVKYNELEEATNKGRAEGIKENQTQIVKNMLNMKMSLEDISKATGLTIQDIQEMQKQS